MKIGIITTHSFPIPYKTHTGDIVILDLAYSLSRLGHTVHLYAPEGTLPPPNVKLFPMKCSYGEAKPDPFECEQDCLVKHGDILRKEDIVHDFSITKQVAQTLYNEGKRNTILTYLGGNWHNPTPAINACVWSEAMRGRAMRGATDYENTKMPDAGGPPQTPLKDAHVVYGGVDTSWYTPTYDKKSFFLWMNRWHPVKGYREAIELAKMTGIELVMAGEHPEQEMFDFQKRCAYEAVQLAQGCSNIRFEWLPPDPDHHVKKRELYRQAKALLYTVQFQEPFGLSQTEALSCGTPVIGTNLGSVPEVINDGITGYVRENDINDLATAIKLIDNIKPETCREYAVKRFDRKVMAASYVKEYEKILRGEIWGL